MDYSKGWKEEMSLEDTKNLAYYERNMLALQLAVFMNDVVRNTVGIAKLDPDYYPCGWYCDTDNNWEGWKRVISLNDGRITFHIPDDFDLGGLQEIKPNWDGSTTEEKWNYIKENCGINLDK